MWANKHHNNCDINCSLGVRVNETDWLFFSLIAPCLAKRSTLVTYAATATTADPEEEEGATMKRQPVGI